MLAKPAVRWAIAVACLGAPLPGCRDDNGSIADSWSPKEQVVDTVGSYLGAINMGNAKAVCDEFAPSLRDELAERGGAPCAELYATAGINAQNDAPGALKDRLPGLAPAAVTISGNRAELRGVELKRSSGRWLIVRGLADEVARAIDEKNPGQRTGRPLARSRQ
jgi:hypothetical protein